MSFPRRATGAIDLALVIAAVPAAAAGAYLAALSTVPAPRPRAAPPGEALHLTVVVPAHNEEAGIAETVKSLLSAEYPEQRRRVLVIADNCTDATAHVARGAGADVFERHDDTRCSKGYALADVFPTLADDPRADGVVVIDADTTVSANFLGVIDAALRAGAPAVQVAYGVRNPEASWRTRLMTIALACFHDVRSLGRERMGLSCGLRGNGMAFSRTTLLAVPHQAHGLVEDAEHGIALGRAGLRVHYAHDARVLGEMPSGGTGARTQRARWEKGRVALRREHAATLVRQAVADRNRVLADLAVDVSLPPLGQLVTAQVCGLAVSAVAGRVLGRSLLSPKLWLGGLVGVGLHVGRGWQVSGTGVRGLADLAKAPVYIGWKLAHRMKRDDEWVRTTRESERAR